MTQGLDKVQAVLDFLEQEPADPGELGFLHMERDGRIVRRHRGVPMRFAFRCFDIPVAALLEGGVSAPPRLSLRAVLGNVPFTGEAAEARRLVLERIRGTNGLLTTDGREIAAQAVMPVTADTTPVALLAHLAGFMLTLKPEVESLAPCLPARSRPLAA